MAGLWLHVPVGCVLSPIDTKRQENQGEGAAGGSNSGNQDPEHLLKTLPTQSPANQTPCSNPSSNSTQNLLAHRSHSYHHGDEDKSLWWSFRPLLGV